MKLWDFPKCLHWIHWIWWQKSVAVEMILWTCNLMLQVFISFNELGVFKESSPPGGKSLISVTAKKQQVIGSFVSILKLFKMCHLFLWIELLKKSYINVLHSPVCEPWEKMVVSCSKSCKMFSLSILLQMSSTCYKIWSVILENNGLKVIEYNFASRSY